MRLFFLSLCAATSLLGQPLSYNPNPMGSLAKPLLLRTYLPDPGLDPAVFANHDQAAKSPRYSPKTGQDTKGEYKMIKAIPAGIAVNHGAALSYVFDTTECRLLYAWQGGFLDMYPYWGDAEKGGRRSFDYVPRLIGNVFYLAKPLAKDEPQRTYLGHHFDQEGKLWFDYEVQGEKKSENFLPSEKPLAFLRNHKPSGLNNLLTQGRLLSSHSGFDRSIKIKEPNPAVGEQVFLAYGCIACHSVDGSKGHGPSLAGLFGKKREIENGEAVLADESYLRESILQPNAKTAQGFPPNYMPPYTMKEKELESVILYLKSLTHNVPE